MQLTGIHHLTAVTGNAPANHTFYTRTLGLRLVKKTVNQDDVSTYHLIYADGRGSPGTDMTFFDWPVKPEQRGTHSITRTGMRVAGADTLAWWEQRFQELGVTHSEIVERDGRLTLDFEDFEGQRLSLVNDGGQGEEANPWERSPVPAERQIRGVGPITMSVPELQYTELVLTKIMGMTRVRDYATPGNEETRTYVYQMGQGGPAAELHVAVEPNLPIVQPGAGGVHHVAFRIPDADYQAWAERLNHVRMPSSGPVDRFYFRSLYFREPNGVLFEIATDGPGFATDEPMDTLGEMLSLPPFLEGQRQQIEAGLTPL
jgi:glyoxalase family protein